MSYSYETSAEKAVYNASGVAHLLRLHRRVLAATEKTGAITRVKAMRLIASGFSSSSFDLMALVDTLHASGQFRLRGAGTWEAGVLVPSEVSL